MKKSLSILLAVVLLMIVSVSRADDDSVRFDGFSINIQLYGSTGGEFADLVRDSLPFRLPDEGEVLMLRFARPGMSGITPDELSQVADSLQLYNQKTDRYLKAIAVNTTPNPSAYFELFFYENTHVQWEDYSVFCNGQEYSIQTLSRFSTILNFKNERENVKPLRDHEGELPTMPPEGGFLEEARPEYKTLAEALIKRVNQGELTVLDGDPAYGEKIAVTVFNEKDVTWKSTLDPESELRDLLPPDRLAVAWEEADTMVLIQKGATLVGYYGMTIAAYKVDTIVTVIDLREDAMYSTYTAFSNDPPDSISTDPRVKGGAKQAAYEYEAVIEQIKESLGGG